MIYIMQKLHVISLFFLSFAALKSVLGNKYASTAGKLLGVSGATMVIVGYDSFMGNMAGLGDTTIFGEEAFSTFFLFSKGLTFFLLFAGGACLYIAVGSWMFTSEEKRAAREADEKEQEDTEKARSAFHPQGSVLNVRNHVVKGSRRSQTERFTEIETTNAVLVVHGEVGSMSKGLTVYTNEKGQLRIGDHEGGRIFNLRGSLQAITAV